MNRELLNIADCNVAELAALTNHKWPLAALPVELYFQPVGVECAWFVDALVGVGAEIIALGLNQIGA